MRYWRYTFLTSVFFMMPFLSFSQGCSDAGLCTIGTHKGSFSLRDTSNFFKNQLTLSAAIGSGDFSTNIITPSLEYAYHVNRNLTLQTKATYNIASGKLGTLADFGDVYLVGVYALTMQKAKLIVNLGLKIPLNEGNLSNTEVSTALPMTYQSSLGTYDLLAGLGLSYKKWIFSLGLQMPLNENNNNSFISSLNSSEAEAFPNTNRFQRAADVLIRVQKQWLLANEKLQLNAGLLGLYHVANDKYTNLNGENITIENSEGLTLNITFGADYRISDSIALGLSWGNPVVVREQRPDGLTRSFVVTPSLRWIF